MTCKIVLNLRNSTNICHFLEILPAHLCRLFIDSDYLEIITPNMVLTATSGVDLPVREYAEEYNPSKRPAYKEQLERTCQEQWIVQCFDSLLPTKA